MEDLDSEILLTSYCRQLLNIPRPPRSLRASTTQHVICVRHLLPDFLPLQPRHLSSRPTQGPSAGLFLHRPGPRVTCKTRLAGFIAALGLFRVPVAGFEPHISSRDKIGDRLHLGARLPATSMHGLYGHRAEQGGVYLIQVT